MLLTWVFLLSLVIIRTIKSNAKTKTGCQNRILFMYLDNLYFWFRSLSAYLGQFGPLLPFPRSFIDISRMLCLTVVAWRFREIFLKHNPLYISTSNWLDFLQQGGPRLYTPRSICSTIVRKAVARKAPTLSPKEVTRREVLLSRKRKALLMRKREALLLAKRRGFLWKRG